jgi:hypothetical protein
MPRPGLTQLGRRFARQRARRLQREDGVERRGGAVEAAEQQPVVVEAVSRGGPDLRGEGLEPGEDEVCGAGGFGGGCVGAEVVNEDYVG